MLLRLGQLPVGATVVLPHPDLYLPKVHTPTMRTTSHACTDMSHVCTELRTTCHIVHVQVPVHAHAHHMPICARSACGCGVQQTLHAKSIERTDPYLVLPYVPPCARHGSFAWPRGVRQPLPPPPHVRTTEHRT